MFPFIVRGHGFVRIERPEAEEIIERDAKDGDCFIVSPDGILHHNHDEVCPYSGLTDAFSYHPEDDA